MKLSVPDFCAQTLTPHAATFLSSHYEKHKNKNSMGCCNFLLPQNSTSKLVDGCYSPHSALPNTTAVSKLIAHLHTSSKQQTVGAALLKVTRSSSRVYHDARKRK